MFGGGFEHCRGAVERERPADAGREAGGGRAGPSEVHVAVRRPRDVAERLPGVQQRVEQETVVLRELPQLPQPELREGRAGSARRDMPQVRAADDVVRRGRRAGAEVPGHRVVHERGRAVPLGDEREALHDGRREPEGDNPPELDRARAAAAVGRLHGGRAHEQMLPAERDGRRSGLAAGDRARVHAESEAVDVRTRKLNCLVNLPRAFKEALFF